MSPEIFREFERILADKHIGESVLEIGAVPTTDSLLNLPILRGAREKIGINLDGGQSYVAGNPAAAGSYSIIEANANDMSCFEADRFDLVLCNSVIEHDKFFRRTLAEIRRVARNGALIVIASPGFDDIVNVRLSNTPDGKLAGLMAALGQNPGCTLTMRIHDWPGDFYRFSPQAYRDVIFSGMSGVQIHSIMIPPRIIGHGYNTK